MNPQPISTFLYALFYWVTLCAFVCGNAVHADERLVTPYTVIGAFNEDDTRHLYEVEVIRLILEKTFETHGPYVLTEAPGMTHSQAISAMTDNVYPNFIRSYGYRASMSEELGLTLIPFPIWRGLIGYRTCFVSDARRDAFDRASSMEDIMSFSHGQGTGWVDVTILRHNGFNVSEVPAYSSLFRMTAKNRFDLFCRGASEVFDEYRKFGEIDGLHYDQSKAFYYPFPHFLYTHNQNIEAIDRVRAGITLILQDGSFEQTWRRYHERNIAFVDLASRQLIRLENPLMKGFDEPFEHLIYKPSGDPLKTPDRAELAH